MLFTTRFLIILAILTGPLLAAETDPVNVTSRPLKELVLYPEYSAPATVVSLNKSRISARITAEIASIPVQVGDQITQGQVLVELDCIDSNLNLQLRRASLLLAEKELNRTRKLAKTSNASAQQLNQRATEYTQAKVARNQAELDVKRCRVDAPFTGIVTARLASEGELASPGTPLLELLDTQRLEISAQIPLNLIDELEQASQPVFQNDHENWPVSMRTLLPQVNTTARNREARLNFTDQTSLPGSAGRIVWRSTKAHVPPDMLVQRDKDVGIFVLNDDAARFIALPAAKIGHPAAIDTDENTRVIVDGRFALQDGSKVANSPD